MDVRTPLLAALLLAGCLGDVPTGGNTGGGVDSGKVVDDVAAGSAFTAMITPIVTSTTHNCASANCHGGTQAPNFTAWAAFKVSGPPVRVAGEFLKPWASNLINTKTATLGTPPVHQVLPWLSTDELATFKTFIDTYGQ